MPKVSSPLFSLDATGNFSKILNFSHCRGKNIVRRSKPKIAPYDKKTQVQLDNRQAWREVMSAWRSLSANEKSWWNYFARGKKMSGLNFYISENLSGGISYVGLFIVGFSLLGDEHILE